MGGVDEPQQETAVDHYPLDEPYFRQIVCEMGVPGRTVETVLTLAVASQSDDVKKVNGDMTFDSIPAP
jgi:hypothetical protein